MRCFVATLDDCRRFRRHAITPQGASSAMSAAVSLAIPPMLRVLLDMTPIRHFMPAIRCH